MTSVLVAVLLAACPEADSAIENPTGATCDSAISYEKDVAPLMSAYCTSCHASGLEAAARRGAPTDHDFDSEVALLSNAQHIIDYAGAGIEGANTAMPPAGEPQPSLAERHLLASYLTCYADADAGPPTHTHDGGGH